METRRCNITRGLCYAAVWVFCLLSVLLCRPEPVAAQGQTRVWRAYLKEVISDRIRVCHVLVCPNFPPVGDPGCGEYWFDPITGYRFDVSMYEALEDIQSYNAKPLDPTCSKSCAASEICGNQQDDDCNGLIDDGCGNCDPSQDHDCCERNQGYPVDIATGTATTVAATDVAMYGAFSDDLLFRRIYDSGLPYNAPVQSSQTYASRYDSYLGAGWTHSFQARLEFKNWDAQQQYAADVLFYRDDGRPTHFKEAGTPGTYGTPPGPPLSLTKVGAAYVLEDLTTGQKHTFDDKGRLTRRQDRTGKGITLAYSGGRLDIVTSDSGQQLKLAYHGTKNLLDKIQRGPAPYSDQVSFSYDAQDRLQQVTYHGGTAPPTGYTYTYATVPGTSEHRLHAVKRGTRLVERFTFTQHNSLVRATKVEAGESVLEFQYGHGCDLDVMGTQITDTKTGQTSCIAFDTFLLHGYRVYGDNAQCGKGGALYGPDGPLVVQDSHKVTVRYYYDAHSPRARVTKMTRNFSQFKTRQVRFRYPATCSPSASCYQPTMVIEQSALATGSCNYAAQDPASAGCRTADVTYDAGSWNVSSVTHKGKTHDLTGAVVDYCYVANREYNTSGQLTKRHRARDCSGGGSFEGVTYSYYPSGSAHQYRLSTAVASGTGLAPGGLALASLTGYGVYGLPTATTLLGVSHEWAHDQVGRLQAHWLGGSANPYTKLAPQWTEGRLKQVMQRAGNWVHYHHAAQGSDPFQRLLRVTRTGAQPPGAGLPVGSEAVVLDYDSTGMPQAQAFHRLPTASGPGPLDRKLQLAFSTAYLSDLKLSSGTTFRKLLYRADTKQLELLRKVFSAQGTDTAATKLVYDPDSGFLAQVRRDKNGSESNDWADWDIKRDSSGNVIEVLDPHSNRVSSSHRRTMFTHDDMHRVVKVKCPDSGTTRLAYNPSGNLVQRVTGTGVPDTRTVSYTYDALDRLTRQAAGTDQVDYTYDTCGTAQFTTGRLCKVVDTAGTTELEYSFQGRLTNEKRTINAAACFGVNGSIETSYLYNANGKVSAVTLAENGSADRRWTVQYQSLAGGQAADDPDQIKQVVLEYGSPPNQKTLASAVTQRSFLSDYTALTLGNGLAHTRSFTEGQLTQETYNGHTWTYAVDWAGRQTSASSSKDQTIGRQYKSAGVGYDRLLRLSQAKPLSVDVRGDRSYTHDDTGNRHRVDYDYKKLGQPTSVQRRDTYLYPAPECTAAPADADSSRLCQAKLHQRLNPSDPLSWTPGPDLESAYQALMAYIYGIVDQANSPEELVERYRLVDNAIVTFCKEQGIPRTIFFKTLLDNSAVRTAMVRLLDGTDSVDKTALKTLVQSAQAIDLSTGLSIYGDGIKVVYVWDSAGRLQAEGHRGSEPADPTSYDLCYGYDAWGRLERVGIPASPTTYDPVCSSQTAQLVLYRYDHRGRRAAIWRAPAAVHVDGPTTTPLGTVEVFTHDQAGRLLASGSKDASQALVLTRQYVHLAGKPLAHVELGEQPTTLLSSCNLSGSQGLLGKAGWLAWLALFVGLGLGARRARRRGRRARAALLSVLLCVLLPLPLAVTSCSTAPVAPRVFYYHTDVLGTPIQVTNESQDVGWDVRLDDFGAAESTRVYDEAAATPLRFPGQYDDQVKALVGSPGPYYNYRRYYDPAIGRYTSPDPLGLWGGWNAYAYADNDPVNNMDRGGDIIETAWDWYSYARSGELFDRSFRHALANPKSPGAWFNAGVDFLGAAVDATAVIVPGMVGGVGAIRHFLRTRRCAPKAVKEGIYEFTSTSGKVYVGQSKNIQRRLKDHARSGKLPDGGDVAARQVSGGKTAREIAEQRRIDQLGGIENLENKINPIGPKRRHLLKGD